MINMNAQDVKENIHTLVDQAFADFVADVNFSSAIYGREQFTLFEVEMSGQGEGGTVIHPE